MCKAQRSYLAGNNLSKLVGLPSAPSFSPTPSLNSTSIPALRATTQAHQEDTKLYFLEL